MLGQPGIGGAAADVPILADLSARHARVRRDGEGYLIEALRDVRVDGRAVPQVAALHDGCRIELGGSVRFWFRRPHALSGTARLDYRQPAPHAADLRRRAPDGRFVACWDRSRTVTSSAATGRRK